MELQDYSLDELKEYIREKERIAERETIPKLVLNPDFTKLTSICVQHIESIAELDRRYYGDDYFTETLMETLYGSDVYDWINERLDHRNG